MSGRHGLKAKREGVERWMDWSREIIRRWVDGIMNTAGVVEMRRERSEVVYDMDDTWRIRHDCMIPRAERMIRGNER